MQNQSHNHNVLDTGRIGSLLMKLTAPMFFGMLIQNIYQTIDTIFIGRYVGSDALASLSIMMPIQMMAWGTSNMVSVGGASLISRLIGQRETQKAERALGNSIFFAVVFAAALTLIIVPFSTFWLKLIGASDNVMPYARTYLIITQSGTILNITGMALLAMARAEGNARVSMIAMILQSVLNTVLDAIFMIGLKMGISGAAIAMIISQGVSLIYVLSYYFTGNSYLKIRARNLVLDMKIVKDIFAIGISQFLKALADCAAGFTIVRMVAAYGGDVGLSAFSIMQRVLTFSSVPSNVLAQAMQPILGFNYGAKRYRQALNVIKLAVILSTALGIFFLLIVVILPGPIARIFTDDPVLIASSITAARIMLLGLPMFGFFNIGQLVFPSIGKALPTFVLSVLRPLLFIIPAVVVLPMFWNLIGAWASFPVSDTMAALLTLALIIPLIRKFQRSAREQENPGLTLEPAEQRAFE